MLRKLAGAAKQLLLWAAFANLKEPLLTVLRWAGMREGSDEIIGSNSAVSSKGREPLLRWARDWAGSRSWLSLGGVGASACISPVVDLIEVRSKVLATQ